MAKTAARQRLAEQLRAVRLLSKSGIVTLVLMSVLGGYLIGRDLERPLDGTRLVLTLLGILFVASGSSALNQVQDFKMDARMERTKKRPLPARLISPAQAIFFSVLTMALGLWILEGLDRRLTWMALTAILSYNGFYTLWWKRKWAWGAVPGAIPGALPIWMGVVAAQEGPSIWTPCGVYLFAVLFFWQMPHFWALAIRYASDYARGGVPILPVVHGMALTVRQITVWAVAYFALILGAPLFLSVGWVYGCIALPLTLGLSWELLRFLRAPQKDRQEKAWLRFFLTVTLSLVVILGAAAADLWSVYPTAWLQQIEWIQTLRHQKT